MTAAPDESPLFFDLFVDPAPHWRPFNWVFLDGHVACRPNIWGASYPIWAAQLWPRF